MGAKTKKELFFGGETINTAIKPGTLMFNGKKNCNMFLVSD